MKRQGNKMIGKAKRIIVEPLEKSELYKVTKIEFAT
jgi:hypothetical protein